jgi:chromosome segregation ATPase
LEADIESYLAKLAEKNKVITERGEEISGLKERIGGLQTELQDLQASLSSLRNEKDSKIKTLSTNISWLEKQRADEIERIRVEKNSEITTLNDKIDTLRQEIRELRKTKATAIPPLIDALNHPDVNVRVGASRALTDFTGKLYGPDQKKWREWWMRNRVEFEK